MSKLRRIVSERAEGRCEYCLSPSLFSPDSFALDHIYPVSLGGESILDNLAYSCGGCNGHKYNKTQYIDPLSNCMSQLFHPRRHQWHDHFQWSEDELLILGVTPVGRATVELLQVNRLSNVNLRRLLKSAGMHPPSNLPE